MIALTNVLTFVHFFPFQTFVSPQVKLPDDVVAPVLPPYTKFPSFDLPKMPIKGSKLSSSHGSGEVSPYVCIFLLIFCLFFVYELSRKSTYII